MNPIPKESPLDQLPAESREQLLEWLEDNSIREVVMLASQSAPHGLGLNVTRSSLQRFARRHRLRRVLEDRSEPDTLLATNPAHAADPRHWHQTLTHLLSRKALDVVLTPQLNPRDLKSLASALHTLAVAGCHYDRVEQSRERVEITKQAQTLAREKFQERTAARAASRELNAHIQNLMTAMADSTKQTAAQTRALEASTRPPISPQ